MISSGTVRSVHGAFTVVQASFTVCFRSLHLVQGYRCRRNTLLEARITPGSGGLQDNREDTSDPIYRRRFLLREGIDEGREGGHMKACREVRYKVESEVINGLAYRRNPLYQRLEKGVPLHVVLYTESKGHQNGARGPYVRGDTSGGRCRSLSGSTAFPTVPV